MGDVIEILTTATNTVEVEAQGPQGIPGVGVPTGGSALQVLRKKTSTDYDTEWAAAGSGSGSVTSVALASTDLTISGSPITDSGTITANIAANAVTLEKLQTISSEHLLGRHGSGNGGVQQIGLGTGLAISGSNVRVATTGITAGTYTKLTIDETGRATVGATATPSDIGAQSTLTEVNVDSASQTSPHQLSGMSAQAVRIYTTEDFTIRLPQTNIQSGNIIEILASTLSATKTISIQRDQSNGGGAWTTIASIASQGQKRKFVAIGTTAYSWQEDSYFTTNGLIGAPAVHTHTPSEVGLSNVSNTAQVTSVSGTAPIVSSGGTTPTISVTTGTTTGTVAAGDDSRFHTRSHAMTGTSDHTASNWSVFYSNGSGQITELPLGAANTVLTSNGASSAPSFAAASGGGATNLWIPASAWIPRTTGGCGVDSRQIGATNRANVDELLFDTGTEEFAQALVVMPSNYNNGTITARFYWSASSGSGGVAWGISGLAYGDDDALDQATGTRIVVTDTFIAADDVHVTSATSAVTIAGTPAANKAVNFQISREVGNGSDTLGVDARLHGVEIIFN